MKINAKKIVELLKQRHCEDIGFAECKTGSSYMHNIRRFDYWAIKPSWAKPYSYGYEIKISRQDFLHDNKWHDYLNYCSEFYFVTPYKLIEINEVPPKAGLLWVTKNGNRVYLKKKAERREVPPENLKDVLFYLLMWRTKGKEFKKVKSIEYWRKWLKTNKTEKRLGSLVKSEIRNILISFQEENELLKKHLKRFKITKIAIDKLNINIDNDWNYEYHLNNKIEELKKKIGGDFVKKLEDLTISIESIKNSLKLKK